MFKGDTIIKSDVNLEIIEKYEILIKKIKKILKKKDAITFKDYTAYHALYFSYNQLGKEDYEFLDVLYKKEVITLRINEENYVKKIRFQIFKELTRNNSKVYQKNK